MNARAPLLAFALCICSRVCRAGDASVSSFPELKQAVVAAKEFRIISVATPEIVFPYQLEVRTKLAIEKSSMVATRATLSGGDSTRLFFLHSHSKLRLHGLNLARGGCPGCTPGGGGSLGGAIFISHAGELILTSVSISESWAFQGGAIYAISSSVIIASDCTLNSNFAEAGGALYADVNSIVKLSNCTMKSNSVASSGGAVCGLGNSTVTMTDCTMTSNSAHFWGGAAHAAGDSTVIVTDCTMTSNSADAGGAVGAAEHSIVTTTNCTMTSNSATFGGAVYMRGSFYAEGSVQLTIADADMSLNRADGGVISSCHI